MISTTSVYLLTDKARRARQMLNTRQILHDLADSVTDVLTASVAARDCMHD
ncbi:hypothetical protein [Rhizobacter sp. OV335]|jgi:hypothetical protein|uniref:hypothetical protein n=1 Tax=Rhizobacter sp. OV335 TaxID=1500264 RepID=UPI0013563273|nr:hypothetical protein [Rhizobacter sp. OV335]